MSNKNFGFTLVELAIVIIIIGLIVSGILQGQELITQARVRAQIKQLSDIDTAAATFRLKYEGLPADLKTPSKFGLFEPGGTGATGLGDGNGLIENNVNSIRQCAYHLGEVAYFFRHLGEASLISGSYTGNGSTVIYAVGETAPTTRIDPNSGLLVCAGYVDGTAGNKNYIYIGASASLDADQWINAGESSSKLRPEHLYSLDTKLDDGKPLTGIFQARYGLWGLGMDLIPTGIYADGSTTSCTTTDDPATSAYTVSSPSYSCQGLLRASF